MSSSTGSELLSFSSLAVPGLSFWKISIFPLTHSVTGSKGIDGKA